MGFTIVCNGCGHVLCEGTDMIPFYQLRRDTDNRCPNCQRKLAIRPVKIEMQGINFAKLNPTKMP